MENWGLITYRETSLLYSDTESSSRSKQWVAIVVAHELAHQWFGNLVTMQWWNDLWLNEGFASWMEYKGVDQIQPDWDMMEQFWSAKMLPALHLDCLVSSHPVSVPVKDPKEIEAIFDAISYKKGSSIIHMLESVIGSDDLRSGLKDYLSEHKFSNAITKDLWRSLSKSSKSGVDVEKMMSTWTLQMGYPLITFTKKDAGGWCLKQTRFLTSAQLNTTDPSKPDSKYNYTWEVPVNYVTDKGKKKEVFLHANSNTTSTQVEMQPFDKWFKANINGSGYYRVQYPLDIWQELSSQLNSDHTVFSSIDRAQLIDDSFSLMRAGLLEETVPLSLIKYLKNERSLVPWEVAIHHLSLLSELFRETDARGYLNKFILSLINPTYRELGWEDTGSHLDKLLRGHILKFAVEAEHKDARDKAKEMFTKLRQDEKSVPANLRNLVYSVGIMTGDEGDWRWCYDKYSSTNIPSERALLLNALGDSTNIFTLQK